MKRLLVSALAALALAMTTVASVTPEADAAAGCSYTSSRPTLRPGAAGPAVKQAQCLSNRWGGVPKLKVDGAYGTQSVRKIKWIQGCHGLRKDGIIGPDTWRALYNPVIECYNDYPN